MGLTIKQYPFFVEFEAIGNKLIEAANGIYARFEAGAPMLETGFLSTGTQTSFKVVQKAERVQKKIASLCEVSPSMCKSVVRG